MDRKTTRPEPVGPPVLTGVRPWDLWDAPFVYETKDLDSFLLFLTEEEARTYELSNLTAYSLTLRVGGPDNSSVLYTTASSRPIATSATRSTRLSTRTRGACHGS